MLYNQPKKKRTPVIPVNDLSNYTYNKKYNE